MKFIVGPGVRTVGRHQDVSMRTYVGKSPRNKKYAMGRWCFNNPISATVFEYNVSRVGEEMATEVIKLMETLLDKTGEMSKAVEMDVWDAVGAIPTPQTRAIGFLGGFIKRASASVGGLVSNEQLKATGGYNPNTPDDSWGVDAYVRFAISYWKEHPNAGPAYVYYSESKAVTSMRKN